MPIDPERWTNNTKAAFSAATGHAASSNHPELTPAHLLDALLQQQETIDPPAADPGRRRSGRAGGQGRTTSCYACPRPRAARSRSCRADARTVLEAADQSRRRPGRRLRVGRAPDPGHGRPDRRHQGRAADRAARRAGQPPGHHGRPRADLPGAGQVRAGPDRGSPRRASSTRSSGATRRSAGSSRCSRAGPRTTRC